MFSTSAAVRVFSVIPIVFVSALILGGLYVFEYQLIWNTYGLSLATGCLAAAQGTVLVLALCSYLAVCFTDPGTTPNDFPQGLDKQSRKQFKNRSDRPIRQWAPNVIQFCPNIGCLVGVLSKIPFLLMLFEAETLSVRPADALH
eukprot:Selendium_serpulae@DN7555_c0_g1_i1.p1